MAGRWAILWRWAGLGLGQLAKLWHGCYKCIPISMVWEHTYFEANPMSKGLSKAQLRCLTKFLDDDSGSPRAQSIADLSDCYFDEGVFEQSDRRSYQKRLRFIARRAAASLAKRGLIEPAGLKPRLIESWARKALWRPPVITRQSTAWRLTAAGVDAAKAAKARLDADHAAYMASLPQETRAELDALAAGISGLLRG